MKQTIRKGGKTFPSSVCFHPDPLLQNSASNCDLSENLRCAHIQISLLRQAMQILEI